MRFDEAAATWDESPARQERSRALADELIPIIQTNRLKTGLDFGAATGLLSVYLTEYLEQITLVDVSEGMIREARRKIVQLGAANMEVRCQDLLTVPLNKQFDILYTLMTLHHVADTGRLLRDFQPLLHPGGALAIADLDAEDGSFHGPGFTGHCGFERATLEKQLRATGFDEVTFSTCYVMCKATTQGMREYPLFLAVAARPAASH